MDLIIADAYNVIVIFYVQIYLTDGFDSHLKFVYTFFGTLLTTGRYTSGNALVAQMGHSIFLFHRHYIYNMTVHALWAEILLNALTCIITLTITMLLREPIYTYTRNMNFTWMQWQLLVKL